MGKIPWFRTCPPPLSFYMVFATKKKQGTGLVAVIAITGMLKISISFSVAKISATWGRETVETPTVRVIPTPNTQSMVVPNHHSFFRGKTTALLATLTYPLPAATFWVDVPNFPWPVGYVTVPGVSVLRQARVPWSHLISLDQVQHRLQQEDQLIAWIWGHGVTGSMGVMRYPCYPLLTDTLAYESPGTSQSRHHSLVQYSFSNTWVFLGVIWSLRRYLQ